MAILVPLSAIERLPTEIISAKFNDKILYCTLVREDLHIIRVLQAGLNVSQLESTGTVM